MKRASRGCSPGAPPGRRRDASSKVLPKEAPWFSPERSAPGWHLPTSRLGQARDMILTPGSCRSWWVE